MGKRSINKPLFCIKCHCDNNIVKGQHCNGGNNEKKHASGLFSNPIDFTLTS